MKLTTKYLLPLLLLVCAQPLYAQKDDSELKPVSFYTELKPGIGIPARPYKTFSEFRLYAKTGEAIDLLSEVAFRKSPFGFAVQVGLNINKLDSDRLNAAIPLPSNLYGPYSKTFVHTGTYFNYSILAGPYLSLHNGDDFLFTLRLLGGVIFGSNPGYGFNYYVSTYTGHITDTTIENPSKYTAPAFDAGLSVRYRASKRLFICLNADLLYAVKPNAYQYYYQSTTVATTGSSTVVTVINGTPSQDFNLMLFNIGISIGYWL